MSLAPQQLTAEERSYLKGKWTVAVMDLEQGIAKAEKRLQAAKDAREVQAEELYAIAKALSKAEPLLAELHNTHASEELLQHQQKRIDKLKAWQQRAKTHPAFLDGAQLQMAEVELEVLKWKKAYLVERLDRMSTNGSAI